jgi:hypothetical protein
MLDVAAPSSDIKSSTTTAAGLANRPVRQYVFDQDMLGLIFLAAGAASHIFSPVRPQNSGAPIVPYHICFTSNNHQTG